MKSYLRVKLIGVYLTAALIGLAWAFTDVSDTLKQVFFFFILGLGLYAWTIKCEKCGTMAFQMHTKDRTGVRLTFFNHPPECPICGIERI